MNVTLSDASSDDSHQPDDKPKRVQTQGMIKHKRIIFIII
jgi:small nuclear ribonucleoprotein (snRNP)-like protein